MSRKRVHVKLEPMPPLEYLGHSEDCGCGCQLTEAEWLAERDNDAGLRLVHFDGAYRTETSEEAL